MDDSNNNNQMKTQLLGVTNNLMNSTQNTQKATQELKNILGNLEQNGNHLSDFANDAKTEVQGVMGEVDQFFGQFLGALTSLSNSFDTLRTRFDAIEETLKSLDNIKNITSEISEISEQSKLLSINARIESARIGEKAKGFQVVASEMQELAQVSDRIVNNIENNVSETIGAITSGIEAGHQGLEETHRSKEQLDEGFQKLKDLCGIDTGKGLKRIEKIIFEILENNGNIKNEIQRSNTSFSSLGSEIENNSRFVSDLIGIVHNRPIINLKPEDIIENIKDYVLIDVRGKDEYYGELGHIQNSRLITIDEYFETNMGQMSKTPKYLFICRSGGRSARATRVAQQLDFSNIYNMEGGMLRWNELNYPTEKS